MPQIHRQLLSQRARARGLTAADLAASSGCSESHVTKILSGRWNPSVPLAYRLASAVGITGDELLTQPQEGASPIRQARQSAGIKVGELATAAGITPQHLNNIEAGRRRPSIGTLRKLADALGRKPGELLDVAA